MHKYNKKIRIRSGVDRKEGEELKEIRNKELRNRTKIDTKFWGRNGLY